MGLFDLFNKKPKLEELANASYMFLEKKDREMVNILFPGGTGELSKVVLSLSLVCKIDLSKCTPETYFKLVELYSMTMLQFGIKGQNIKLIASYLRNKYPELVVTDNIAIRLCVFYKMHFTDKTFFLNNEISIKMFEIYVKAEFERDKIIESNNSMFSKNLSDEDYGHVATKPIYVAGGVGANEFLNNLCGACGDFLTWDRVDVKNIDGINGMVDVYESKTVSGDIYAELYLNVYSHSTSTTIPKNFCSKSDIDCKVSKFAKMISEENDESGKIRNALYESQKFDKTDYGLSIHNPIVTSSEIKAKNILSRLRNSSQELLFWIKEGTMIVNEINGIVDVPVDVYQLYCNGEKYAKIHICPYGRDSLNAPYDMLLDDASTSEYGGSLEEAASSQEISISMILALQQLDYENKQLKRELKERMQKTIIKSQGSLEVIDNKYKVFIFDAESKTLRKEIRNIDTTKFPPSKYAVDNTYYVIETIRDGKRVRTYYEKKNWDKQLEISL